MTQTAETSEITRYLSEWRRGDHDALGKITSIVNREFKIIARSYLRRENANCSIQTTELVNESYIRLLGQRSTEWQDRKHFYAIAAKVMRNFLIDHARKRKNSKRGGAFDSVAIEGLKLATEEKDADLLKLDEALSLLEQINERQSRIVELKFFAGMTSREVAELLDISEITVKRDWLKAKVFLYTELSR
ncbi:MAG: ECF-type sigma factor [Pyrinomonadaceae bacterium]